MIEHLMDRSASCWALATRSGVKYPRSTPSFNESFVSISEATANSIYLAKSAGRNRPNQSEMFFVADAAELRIWSRNSKSFAAGPVPISAYTSTFSASASCQTSSSSYRRATAMMPASSHSVPERRFRTSNLERRTSNVERSPSAAVTGAMKENPRRGSVCMNRGLSAESPSAARS